MKRLIVVMFLVISVMGFAKETYWTKLKKKADKVYSGIDLEIGIKLGSEVREDNDSQVKGSVEIKVPIYSKAERYKKQQARIDFYSRGASLIQQLSQAERSQKVLKKKVRFLKQVLSENGINGVNAYYDCLEQYELKKDEIVRLGNELDNYLR